MAEVYAVPGTLAPSPAAAYPIWHEDVCAITVGRLSMQPYGERALCGAVSAIENRSGQDDGRQLSPVPARLQLG
jgi:hypothetical protein